MRPPGDSYKTKENLEHLASSDVDVPPGDNWKSSGFYSTQAHGDGNGSASRYLGIQWCSEAIGTWKVVASAKQSVIGFRLAALDQRQTIM